MHGVLQDRPRTPAQFHGRGRHGNLGRPHPVGLRVDIRRDLLMAEVARGIREGARG